MPLLDVTDVILDVDFLDCLQLQRATKTVGTNGLVSLAAATPALQNFYGVVTNDKGEVLRRQAAGENVEGAIMVVTLYRLTSGHIDRDTQAQIEADIVHWNDRSWVVKNVGPYPRYGRGFVQASCVLLPFAGSDG